MRRALRAHPWDAELIRYRAVASAIPEPNLGLSIADGTGEDAHVQIRGSTRNLGDVVPRRFLEAIAGKDQSAPSTEPAAGSGRLDLARRVVDPSNPLLARVLVNRVWKHHFGEGIVRTPDDFGLMGRPPSHPELLDDLARRFIAGGFSIKSLHRLIVLSSTYRMSSDPATGHGGDSSAEQVDPSNERLHRMNLRRLEAEVLRDTLLSISGRLDPRCTVPASPPT